jgi:hypothetical protein
MEIETASQQAPVTETPVSLPFPNTRWGRVLYGLFVLVFPILSFSSVEFLEPQWQTGRLPDYIVLFLFPTASLFFFPLLAYSIVSYILLLLDPTRFAGAFPVRLGIYTGVLLALQYSVLVLAYALDSVIYWLLLIWIIPFIFSPIYRRTVARWTAPRVNGFLIVVVIWGLVLGGLFTRGNAPFVVLIGLTMAAPFWSFLLALRASTWLIKNYETRFNLTHGLGLAAWLAAYVAAWRYNILKMYELYAALPPTPPPDCYIATAAARGHPGLVRSWTVRRADGSTMQVNAQLQRLKCAELALLAVAPRVHRGVRRIYDRAGQDLAQCIQGPYLADLAYLFLIPWEELAQWVLKLLIPEIDSISRKIYMSSPADPAGGRHAKDRFCREDL